MSSCVRPNIACRSTLIATSSSSNPQRRSIVPKVLGPHTAFPVFKVTLIHSPLVKKSLFPTPV